MRRSEQLKAEILAAKFVSFSIAVEDDWHWDTVPKEFDDEFRTGWASYFLDETPSDTVKGLAGWLAHEMIYPYEDFYLVR